VVVTLLIILAGCGNSDPASVSQIPLIEQTPTIFPTTALPPVEPTPTSAQTLTELEAIDVEMRGKYGSVHPDCSSCIPLPTGANCTKYLWTKPISRTEWLELFPDTNFYLIGLQRIENPEDNREGYRQDNFVIAQQDDKRYTVDSYDKLLAANGMAITDERREQIARSFALMTLANYLEKEIVFQSWEEGSWPAAFDLRYNYKLKLWTEIQGFTVDYLFWFEQDRLLMVRWDTTQTNSGDYIEEPVGVFSPLAGSLSYFSN
jgi:hypothetical protein